MEELACGKWEEDFSQITQMTQMVFAYGKFGGRHREKTYGFFGEFDKNRKIFGPR